MKAETIVSLSLSAAAWSVFAHPLADRSPQSTPFSALVVFGDSFSDNGNGSYRLTNGSWPPSLLGYYDGHFSNGPVWAEFVAGNLSVPLLDYAIGGATTSNALVQGYTGPSSSVLVPSVLDQIAGFLDNQSPQGTVLGGTTTNLSSSSSSSPLLLAKPLLVIMAGANDVFFDAGVSAAQSYRAIARGAAQLAAAYPAATVLTVAQPDMAQLPYGFFADALTRSELRTFADELADLLAWGARGSGLRPPAASSLASASASAVPGADQAGGEGGGVALNVDLRRFFDDLDYYAEPQAYGFGPLGKYGSCLVGAYGETAEVSMCDEVGEWVYWDEYHPTTHTHSWMARQVMDAISP